MLPQIFEENLKFTLADDNTSKMSDKRQAMKNIILRALTTPTVKTFFLFPAHFVSF